MKNGTKDSGASAMRIPREDETIMYSIDPYVRRAYYYETDQMGIVHHSNYIRWFEEARIDFMRQTGLNYGEMEQSGIVMPVTHVLCKYIVSIRFDEEVEIIVKLNDFNGIRAAYCYEVYANSGRSLAVIGESGHCFLDAATRTPVSIKKRYPALYERGLRFLEEKKSEHLSKVLQRTIR